MGVTATRSSTTEPMLVGDAFTSSCGAVRGASGPGDGSPDELDDAGPKGAELPRPRAYRWAVPADVLRRAAPRRDAGASPAAAEFHRAVLRAGAPDGSRVIYQE